MAGETYNVIIDKRARLKLQNIVSYLRDNASVNVANKVRAGLLDAIDSLDFMPTRYVVYHRDTEADIVYRRALKWKYVIIFIIQEATMTVRVVDIVHSAQDPKRIKDGLTAL